jgi:DNA repair exonuclease SbcCD ATPase subunit
MPDIETTSPAPGQVSDSPAPSTEELGGDSAQTPEVETNGRANGDQKPESFQQKQKRESQFQRARRQKAEHQKRESELKAREERLAQVEREKNAPKKPDYTAADLKKYRQSWENEGRFDLVEKADEEIKRLEALEQQERGQTSFVQEWQTAERELAEADKEFGAGKGTRLDKKLSEIMQGPDGNVYRQHPRGIVAAYHRAKMELLQADHQTAQGKIQQLENELKRLTGLTSIGGGAPGRIGTGGRVESLNDFARLSSADMLKHLKSQSNKGDMPWL